MVEDMVETCCMLVEYFLDQVLPHFDFDFAAGNVVVPRYKRIHEKLKKAGIDIWYVDCDGDVRLLLSYFLESGINCLFPYEVNSCCQPKELLDEYGKDLRIMGGMDKMVLAQSKEP